MKYILVFILGYFTLYVHSTRADTIIFQNGKTINDVKVRVKKDVVEILYNNGKREVRNKKEFKKSKIKLAPVTWATDADIDKMPGSTDIDSKKESRQTKIAKEMVVLETQREVNFAIPQ